MPCLVLSRAKRGACSARVAIGPIVYELVRFALAGILCRLHLGRSDIRAPKLLCLALARLGTTFIKFGQGLSLRRDLLPDDYVTALQSLQDHIAPFPAEHAMRQIERGLGRPITQIFAVLDRTPLAAASVAQVHTARLHDGRDVTVKVRRPGIKAQIDRDLRALMWVTRYHCGPGRLSCSPDCLQSTLGSIGFCADHGTNPSIEGETIMT